MSPELTFDEHRPVARRDLARQPRDFSSNAPARRGLDDDLDGIACFYDPDIALRDAEVDAQWCFLNESQQRIAGAHVRSGVDLSRGDPAGERCPHVGVGELLLE